MSDNLDPGEKPRGWAKQSVAPTGHGLGDEVRLVQNPAIGAFLLWRFVCAYTTEGGPTPFPSALLLFLVLPMILHEETCSLINSTQKASGLRLFAAKFSSSEHKKSDLLYAIHPRVHVMRRLSLEALRLAVASNLLAVEREGGLVFAVSNTYPKSATPDQIGPLIRATERFAAWCAPLAISEIAASLKVEI